MSIFVEKEAAAMSVRGSIQGKREGGAIWLIAFIVVGVLWGTPVGLWHKLLLNWSLIGVAFASVRYKQRYITGREALLSAALTVAAVIIAWLIGFPIERHAMDAVHYSDNEIGNLLVLAPLIAVCVVLWMLSAIWIRAVAESGGAPARTLGAACRRLVSEPAIWSLGLVVIVLHQILFTISLTDFVVIRIVGGIALSRVQIRMLNVLNGGDSPRPLRVPDWARTSYLKNLGLASALLGLLYLLLSAAGGLDRGLIMGYPFGWLFGVGYAVVATVAAVLVDYARRCKIIVLFVIIVITLIGDLVVFIEASDHILIIDHTRIEIDF